MSTLAGAIQDFRQRPPKPHKAYRRNQGERQGDGKGNKGPRRCQRRASTCIVVKSSHRQPSSHEQGGWTAAQPVDERSDSDQEATHAQNRRDSGTITTSRKCRIRAAARSSIPCQHPHRRAHKPRIDDRRNEEGAGARRSRGAEE